MEVASVNVGLPRQVLWNRQQVSTAIFKEPIAGPARVRTLNLDGDRQADLSVHGGPDKAVYGYAVEHYEYWHNLLPDMPAGLGVFGENLTTRGVLEQDLHIGDELRVGSARLRVAQPRMPCYKLQVRFDRADMTRLFAISQRSGFYFSVVEEGELQAGDAIEFVQRDEQGISVADIFYLYFGAEIDRDLLDRALRLPGLTLESRSMLLRRMRLG